MSKKSSQKARRDNTGYPPPICSEIRAKAEVLDQIRGQITTWLNRSDQYVEEADRDGNVEDRGIHLRVSSVLRELDRLADAFLETERQRQEALSQNVEQRHASQRLTTSSGA